MTPTRRRSVAVVAVLGIVALVAVTQFRGGTPAPAVTRQRPSNGTSRARGNTAEVPVTGLKLDLLNHAGAEYLEPERNPFQFRAVPAPAGPRAGGRSGAPRAAAPPVPAGPPPLPPIPWRFIGVFEMPGGAGRVGIFSDGRGSTAQAREGDIIDGRYRVLRVGPDSADVAYADGRGRQSLRLSGQ